MNLSGSTRRKLTYVLIIALLLVPLYYLGQPLEAASTEAGSGGRLAQLRARYDLSEGDLGDIDPASASMRLATLGMRGIAATMLWQKSHAYKRRQEWERFTATLNQIALLQPHYENVWEHQAHNLSYNVSVEFDDYTQRYDWVRRGLEYLMKGVRQNRKAPRLYWQTGWFFGHKIGRADEKVQFRDLFRKDDDFHTVLAGEGINIDSAEARGPDGRPDNWLVSRLWHNRGYDLVDGGVALRGKAPVPFYSAGPLSHISHSSAIETEGVLDERAKESWMRSDRDWNTFGERVVPTTWNTTVRLASLGDRVRRANELKTKFGEMIGDLPQKIYDERLALLTAEERQAIDTPEKDRTQEQTQIAQRVVAGLFPSYTEIARAMPPDQRLAALDLADRLARAEEEVMQVEAYRDQINYTYWEIRCAGEQDDDMIDARRLMYDAEQALKQANLDEAIKLFDQSWLKWAAIFKKYPILMVDVASEDLIDSLRRYQQVLDNDEFPDDFPLVEFIKTRTKYDADPDEFLRLQARQFEERQIRGKPEGAGPDNPPSNGAPESNSSPESSEPAESSDPVESAAETSEEAAAGAPASPSSPAEEQRVSEPNGEGSPEPK